MRKQFLLLFSILCVSSGLVFACPAPVNISLSPTLVPVNKYSSVTYDINPGDTSFHVETEQVTTTLFLAVLRGITRSARAIQRSGGTILERIQ